MVNLILPYPPTVNTYWRKFKNHMVISPRGRPYKNKVAEIIKQLEISKFTGFVKLEISLVPPDSRKRDVDNVLKSLLDALTAAHIWEDDYQVKAVFIERMDKDPEKQGFCVVRIAPVQIKN